MPFALRDGTEVLLRPVRAIDRERIRTAFHRLSPESRYLRFFAGKTELSEELLTYFSEVDQVNHVAWGAIDPRSPDLRGLGLGRFARRADDPTKAETAVAVADEVQRKGLGTVLLAILYVEAEARGVRALTALVLPENHFALEWFQSLGATFELKPDAYELELPVNREVLHLVGTESAERFAHLVAQVEPIVRAAGTMSGAPSPIAPSPFGPA